MRGVSATHDVTHLLAQWAKGDDRALEDLTPLVYKELRRLAASHLRKERRSHTLQPTALVHEAYLRLVGQNNPLWEDRTHFYGVAARLMRQILVEHARRKRAIKRAARTVSLEHALSFHQERGRDLVALDNALTALEKLDPRKCKAVELRYFGGLSIEETAQLLGISAPTVKRRWSSARAWLRRELRRAAAGTPA